MTNKIKSMFSRLAAKFLKPTLALLAALVVGGAWAVTYTESQVFSTGVEVTEGSAVTGSSSADSPVIFSAGDDESGLTVTTGNMVLNDGYWKIASGSYHFASDLIINNGSLNVCGGTVSTEWWLPIRGGGLVVEGGTVSVAPVNGGQLVVSQGDNQNCSVTVKSGTLNVNGKVEAAYGTSGSVATVNVVGGEITVNGDYQVAENGVGTCTVGGSNTVAKITVPTTAWAILTDSASANGTLTLKKNGSFICPYLNANSSQSSLVFDGGTLIKNGDVGNRQGFLIGSTDAGDSANARITVTKNGGTIDVGAIATSIGVSVTGVGTITKKGTGTLTFTGDMSGFIGRVAVASGAGSVTLPATATRARAGDYTAVTTNQDGTFTFAYDSTGTASATVSVELLNLDFEDENTYGAGWTFSSDGYGGGERHSLATRELYEEESAGVYKTSKFLMLEPYTGNGNRGSKAVYDLSVVFASANEYTLEFDYFAGMCYSDYNYLELNTANGRVVYFYTMYDSKTSRQTKVYLNGSETVAGAFSAADRAQYPNNAEYKSKWVHVIVTASQKKGIRLTVRSADGNSNVLQETFVTDFDRLTSFVASARNKFSTGTSASGIDNVVATIPGVASVDGANYATFASAVDAATSTSTITLCGDVELTSSVVLPYGATVNLSGNVLYTSDDNVAVTFDDGVHYLASTAAGGVKTFSETVTLPDTTYIWTGNGDGISWSNSGNWSLAGSAVMPSGDTAEVFIPADVTSTIDLDFTEDLYVKEVKVNGNVTFRSSSGKYLYAETISGTGTLTLQDTYFRAFDGKNLNFEENLNIVIADGYTATFRTEYSTSERYIYFKGKLTGTGTIKLDQQNKQNSCGGAFEGDATQFGGEVVAYNHNSSGPRERTYFKNGNATSASASYEVYGSGDKSDMFGTDNETYHLGSLNGSVGYRLSSGYRNGCTIVVGERNEDCSFGGRLSRGQKDNSNTWYANGLKKEGTKKLTITGSGIANIEIANGVLDIAADSALPMTRADGDYNYYTIKFTGGTLVTAQDPSKYIRNCTTHAISFSNAVNDVHTWSTALESSNTAGLTKKGAGALTLSQPPEYTGTTTVEGGVLYIVEGYSPTLAAGTVEMASDKTGYKKYVPAAAAAAHVGNVYYPTFAEAWTAAGNDDNAAWIYLDAAPAQDDVVTLTEAWQRVRVANGTYSAEGHIAISGSLANVALKTSLGAEMTEYTACPTVTVTVVPGTGVASGEIAAGYISKDGAVYTIYSGSEVTITWTATEGYEFAGGESTATTVISPTENVTPECPAATAVVVGSVSIAAPVVGAYGNDFATVSVTAGVTSTYPAATEITYTLKANGTAIATTTAAGDATSVTFGNANVSGLTRYGNISYTVEASGDNVTAATSGATTAMLADSEGWIDEKMSTTGTTGSWKTADGAAATVTYDNEERAELSDNKFSATNCSTGDVVTVTIKDVIYTALSDTSAVDADAQGSIALGGTESAPKFMVLTKSGDTVQWSEAAGVNPALNTSYTIVFTFDYNNNKYSITVNGTALTVGGSATYDIVKTTNKYVKDIDFLGAGSIKAIEGIQYDAMMAVDQNGVRYATVADALNANKSVKGAIIKLLHGTANTNIAGWNYNADTMTFIKKAVGLIFLAF